MLHKVPLLRPSLKNAFEKSGRYLNEVGQHQTAPLLLLHGGHLPMYFSPLFAARYYRQTFLKEIGQQSHLCIQLLFMLPLLGFKGTAYLLEAFPLIFQNIDNHCSFYQPLAAWSLGG